MSQLGAQGPRQTPEKPTYRRVGVYFPPSATPQVLHANIGGSSFGLNRSVVYVDDATRGTILNALEAASADVRVYDTLIDLKTMQRHKLDAFFWPKYTTVTSSLVREGTLIPSYTSYSNATMKLMRVGGFRGTLDSIEISATGTYSAFGLGASRAGIAKRGAESALRDMATKLVRALSFQ